jgi:hypothetical protein
MNDGSEKMKMEVVVTYFKILFPAFAWMDSGNPWKT